MAFNPTPEVAAARDIANRFGKEQVIVIMLDNKGGYTLSTYGKTASLCRVAAKLGEAAIRGVELFIANIDRTIK